MPRFLRGTSTFGTTLLTDSGAHEASCPGFYKFWSDHAVVCRSVLNQLRCSCRRGKIIFTNETTNETTLWNLFMNNSTVDIVVSSPTGKFV